MYLKNIQNRIYELRGQKIMMDFDLAELYEVETRILNQSVKRNNDLFPTDFMFRLTKEEWEIMRSQIVMASEQQKRNKNVTPYAFTEHGVTMLANVLKSKKARQTSISIVRAFIALKEFVLNYDQLSDKIKEMEKTYNKQFKDVYDAINYLIQKDKKSVEQKERKRIWFKEE